MPTAIVAPMYAESSSNTISHSRPSTPILILDANPFGHRECASQHPILSEERNLDRVDSDSCRFLSDPSPRQDHHDSHINRSNSSILEAKETGCFFHPVDDPDLVVEATMELFDADDTTCPIIISSSPSSSPSSSSSSSSSWKTMKEWNNAESEEVNEASFLDIEHEQGFFIFPRPTHRKGLYNLPILTPRQAQSSTEIESPLSALSLYVVVSSDDENHTGNEAEDDYSDFEIGEESRWPLPLFHSDYWYDGNNSNDTSENRSNYDENVVNEKDRKRRGDSLVTGTSKRLFRGELVNDGESKCDNSSSVHGSSASSLFPSENVIPSTTIPATINDPRKEARILLWKQSLKLSLFGSHCKAIFNGN